MILPGTPAPLMPDAEMVVEVGGDSAYEFAAAHTGMHDGVYEPLHGHTYTASLTVRGVPDEAGMVADFAVLKAALREALAPLKRRTLVATRAPGTVVDDDGKQVSVDGPGGRWSLPQAWVVPMPVAGTSTEHIAAWLLADVARRLPNRCPRVREVAVTVRESADGAVTARARRA